MEKPTNLRDWRADGEAGFCDKKTQTARPGVRAKLVEKEHPKLSLRQQCEILGVSRSTLAYQPVEESEEIEKL